MSCGVCRLQMRLGSGAAVAVVYRPAATALIRPLAWEPPYATSAALKRQKNKTKKYLLVIPPLLKFRLEKVLEVIKNIKNTYRGKS